MLQLHARLSDRWDAEPAVVRLRDHNRSDPLGPHDAVLHPATDSGTHRLELPARLTGGAGERRLALPQCLSYLADGDIVRIVPTAGELSVVYRQNSDFNTILVTERCNSNCLMCSQPPKKLDDAYLVDAFMTAIPLMSQHTRELGITGGEPTLLGERFIALLRSCKQQLPDTSLHVLSNGRLFNYLSFAQAVAQVQHPDLMIGIPLYADTAAQHDFVVQARGAFDQTIRGIMNLERCGVKVEIRVVLHQQTIGRLPQLCRFIARNLPFVDHVALMGLEMMGYVKMNLPGLWIDPADYQAHLRRGVAELDAVRLNVSIYNHQLCVLERSLWPLACKSISDWKNEYLPVCRQCAVKNRCGGFFASAKLRYSDHIRPFERDPLETCS